MRYYSIEWHTHTTHSDAQQTTMELVNNAQEFGYDILSISDHNTTSAYDELKGNCMYGKRPFIFKGSIEWTTYYGHMLVLGANEIIDWSIAKPDDIDSWINKIKMADGLIGVAHPFKLGSPICTGCHWDFLVRNWDKVDFIEIFNGNSPQNQLYNEQAYKLWSDLLKEGRHISCSSGRDWHRPKKVEDNVAINYIGLEEISSSQIKQSIRQGNFYVTLGPTCSIQVKAHSNSRFFQMGSLLNPGMYEVDVELGETSNNLNGNFMVKPTKLRLLQNEECIEEIKVTEQLRSYKVSLPLKSGEFRVEVVGSFQNKPDVKLIIANPFYVS
ncbi:CehA/McbA family metallohydrolase [Liquorilactobacillus cacaonum]|nr:CehA/McbA family metallohydrolase [Liquorilactobacillus cacaonum]